MKSGLASIRPACSCAGCAAMRARVAGLRKGWYGQAHFSVALIRAIQARYRLEGEEAGYRVFVPRTRTSTAP